MNDQEMREKLAKYLKPNGIYDIRRIIQDQNPADESDPLGLDATMVAMFGGVEDRETGETIEDTPEVKFALAHNEAVLNPEVAKKAAEDKAFIETTLAKTADEVTYDEMQKLVELGVAEYDYFAADGEGEIVPIVLKSGSKPSTGVSVEKHRQFKRGDAIEVKPRTAYQHLSGGAVVNPMIARDLDGYKTTIRDIFQEKMEDEHGNEVIEIIIETATGELVKPSDIL